MSSDNAADTGEGKTIPLPFPGESLRIGRDAANQVVLRFKGVSRTHAEIVCHDGIYVIKDWQSHNGTFVNDQKIESVELHSGDRIRIVKAEFRVVGKTLVQTELTGMSETPASRLGEDLPRTQRARWELLIGDTRGDSAGPRTRTVRLLEWLKGKDTRQAGTLPPAPAVASTMHPPLAVQVIGWVTLALCIAFLAKLAVISARPQLTRPAVLLRGRVEIDQGGRRVAPRSVRVCVTAPGLDKTSILVASAAANGEFTCGLAIPIANRIRVSVTADGCSSSELWLPLNPKTGVCRVPDLVLSPRTAPPPPPWAEPPLRRR